VRCPARELRLGGVNGTAQLANKLPAADSRCEDEQKQTLRGNIIAPRVHASTANRRRALVDGPRRQESARSGHVRLIIPWRYSELGHRVL
jgi:hypothetical protein